MASSKHVSDDILAGNTDSHKKTTFLRRFVFWATIVTAVVFLVGGIMRSETSLILNKAVRICLECIGIG